MIASKLMKALQGPAKVASALDWKKASGSILSMDIGTNGKISLAVSGHPSFLEEKPKVLDPISMELETREGNRRTMSREAVAQFQDIVKQYNVAGFLVNWPVQPEGRCGAPCGKTLHAVESLLEESSTIMNQNRPLCLWDEHHFVDETDDFGRNKIYGEVPSSDQTEHLARTEQYAHETSGSMAVKVWNDFCKKQWPELYQQQQQQTRDSSRQSPNSSSIKDESEEMVEFPENYEDTSAYMSVPI
jgi:RNase H-fold protein (predicted Holliday junction resolvase)